MQLNFSFLNPLYLLKATTFFIDPFTGMLIAGGVGNLFSSFMGASAEEKAARAAQREAQRTRNVAMQIATPSFNELQQVDKLLESQARTMQMTEQALAKQFDLLESVDPAIKEAGSQALDLLRGKEAAILSPIRKSREKRRAQLESELSQRLGPGWRTSTAGIQAMAEFDTQTDTLLFGAQDQTIGRLLGVAVQARPDIISEVGKASAIEQASAGAVLGAEGTFKNRALQSLLGTSEQIQKTSGAEYVAEKRQADTLGDLFGAATKIGSYGILREKSASDVLGGKTESGMTFGELEGLTSDSSLLGGA